MRSVIIVAGVVGLFVAAGRGASAQVELDRIVSRVSGTPITRSDVRQARQLKLIPETENDDAALRGLENRLLILAELARAAPLDPVTDAELSARRREWEGALGSTNVAGALADNGMNEAALQSWLRDDCRIRAYLKRQFSALPEPDRVRATADWLARLRQRGGLH